MAATASSSRAASGRGAHACSRRCCRRRTRSAATPRAALERWRGRVVEIGVERGPRPARPRSRPRPRGRRRAARDRPHRPRPRARRPRHRAGQCRGAARRLARPAVRSRRPITGALLGPTVKAGLTTTFAGYKRSLLLHPGASAPDACVVDRHRHPARRGRAGHHDVPARGRRRPRAFPAADLRCPQGQLRPSPRHRRLGRARPARRRSRAAPRCGAGSACARSRRPRRSSPSWPAWHLEPMTEPLAETAGQAIGRQARDGDPRADRITATRWRSAPASRSIPRRRRWSGSSSRRCVIPWSSTPTR